MRLAVRESLSACLPSQGRNLAVAGLLAGLALTDRLASQGARIGSVTCPRLGLWLIAAAAVAFFLARPATRPLRTGPMLVTLLVLSLAGWLLHQCRQALFGEQAPLLARVVDASEAPQKLVELPLILDGRRRLGRLLGRPRHIGFTADGVLYTPEAGIYRFELSCDDRCQIGVDKRGLQAIAGDGLVLAELARGYHELRVVYEQSSGEAHFALRWDRPRAVELLGLFRYVGRDRHAVDPGAVHRDHARAAALLLSEAFFFSLAFGWLLRAGEHVSSHPEARGFLLVNATVTLAAAWIFARAGLPERFAAAALLVGAAAAAWLLARSTMGLSWDRARAALKTCLVIAASVVLAVLVDQHVSGVNGPAYWRWPWRRLGGPSLYLAMSAPLMAFFAAQRIRAHGFRSSLPISMSLLMVSNLSLQLVAIGFARHPFGLQDVARRVMDPSIGSSYVDAAGVGELRGWLRSYPRLSPSLHYHSQNKPPGPILFHRAFQWGLGKGARSAQAAGLAIGVLACLSIPACFFLIRLLTRSAEAGFHGASFLALSPGPVLFFPEMDQTYILLSCALIGSWALALTRRRLAYAVGFGLVLSLVLFTSYTLLALGLFLGLLSLSSVALERTLSLRFAFTATAVALATVITLYASLFWATGFDPLESFRMALANQARLLPQLARPYPASIAFDLLDFCMGAGWISALLIAFFLIESAQAGSVTACLRVAAFALLQIVGLACTGLIQTETARVWQFLLPLFLCPVGCELAGWRPASRNAVYLCLWFLTVTLCRNMTLIQ